MGKFNLDEVQKYKYIHIMNNGFHTFTILNFINKYFDNLEHCFIFPNPREETKLKIDEISNAYSTSLESITIEFAKKIVFHGLFTKTVIEYLYCNSEWLSKSYWYIWGGDLYNIEQSKEGDFVRSNFAGILTAFDRDIYEEKFGKPKKYFDLTYPHKELELNLLSQKNETFTHIQINNCEDETTLEMLDILAKFKDEHIKISTILSYKSANHKNVKDMILEKGYAIFGNKFNPILDYLCVEDYTKHLGSVDIYISNQNRQQGNGNAAVICSLGKKVFTKSDTSVYKKYNELGIKYYDTHTIKDLSYKEFIFQDDKIKEKSVKKLKERMANKTKVAQWENFFCLNKHFNLQDV